MVTIEDAICKAISMKGANILNDKKKFCLLLEDLVPNLIEDRKFIEMIYCDEFGKIFSEAMHATYKMREVYLREADKYLAEKCCFIEVRRHQFLGIFEKVLRGKVIQVKKYKEYKPALALLKQEYGKDVPIGIIKYFVEENRLFSRFSITLDDVIADLEAM